MDTTNKNDGGQLNLYIDMQHTEFISDWVRENLQKEPIEVSKPHEETCCLEIYFDSYEDAAEAEQNIPSKLPIQSTESKPYKEEDWTTFWQHHFKTTEFGKNLRIVPEWETAPDDDKINIIINPGLSFGTGGHFTTQFCLETLEMALEDHQIETMIDAGTGSGILSIAAIKLNIPSVDAFDYDPICVEQCHENAIRNALSDQINFFQADVLEPGWHSEPVDLVCANILTSVLIEAAPIIKAAAKKRILLSGIRNVEVDEVAERFTQLGCKEVFRDNDEQWSGLVFDLI